MPEEPDLLKESHWEEIQRFMHASRDETDRGLALICAAMVDDLLGRCIKAFLLDRPETNRLLEGFNAPLGTFSARSVAAFALGLLSEDEFLDCEIIRKVRNEFAHNVHVAFKDQKIEDLCDKLKYSWGSEPKNIAKGQFASASIIMVARLRIRPDAIDERGDRLKYPSWQGGEGPSLK